MVIRRCPKCHTTSDDQYGFCIKCGYEFPELEVDANTCPLCNYSNPEEAEYCVKCGSPLIFKEQFEDLSVKAIILGIIGARLYYVFTSWNSFYVSGDFVATFLNIIGYSKGNGFQLAGLAINGGIFVAIATWLSTLFLEAIAEGLQLMEDIKNK